MQQAVATVRPPNRESFTLVLDRRLELGREGGGIIVVDTVSRAAMSRSSRAADEVVVTDLGSANGTTLNGSPLEIRPRHRGIRGPIGDTRIEVGEPRPASRTRYTELVSPPRRARPSGRSRCGVDDLQAHVLEWTTNQAR